MYTNLTPLENVVAFVIHYLFWLAAGVLGLLLFLAGVLLLGGDVSAAFDHAIRWVPLLALVFANIEFISRR